MNKIVQLSNLSDDKYSKLEARATSSGMTIAEYLESLIEKEEKKLTMSEFFEILKTREPVRLNPSAEQIIREERDARS